MRYYGPWPLEAYQNVFVGGQPWYLLGEFPGHKLSYRPKIFWLASNNFRYMVLSSRRVGHLSQPLDPAAQCECGRRWKGNDSLRGALVHLDRVEKWYATNPAEAALIALGGPVPALPPVHHNKKKGRRRNRTKIRK